MTIRIGNYCLQFTLRPFHFWWMRGGTRTAWPWTWIRLGWLSLEVSRRRAKETDNA